jgi:hypothetical protein
MLEENIKNILKEYKEETMRHFDVVAEDLRATLRLWQNKLRLIRENYKSTSSGSME